MKCRHMILPKVGLHLGTNNMLTLLSKFKIYLILGAIILGFGAAVYIYYKDTQAALETYAANQARLETSLALQKAATDSLRGDIVKMTAAITTINAEFAQSRQQVKDLELKFSQTTAGDPRDIGVLAATKPALVEKIVNTATQDVLRCFELLAGDSANPGENNNEKFSSCITDATNPSSMQQ